MLGLLKKVYWMQTEVLNPQRLSWTSTSTSIRGLRVAEQPS